ncbi:MAG TPA: hypothetical protein VNU44_00615, partial [Bryobacteraceae bacterium]|nr:hypothetical protein [Bryobacteraceae bacterium]
MISPKDTTSFDMGLKQKSTTCGAGWQPAADWQSARAKPPLLSRSRALYDRVNGRAEPNIDVSRKRNGPIANRPQDAILHHTGPKTSPNRSLPALPQTTR